MKLNKYNSAIILPYKENFCNKGFGAVSIWVKDYVQNNKICKDLIFCRKINDNTKYLTNNVKSILLTEKYFKNFNYIKKINFELIKQNIKIVEVHNRPEYAIYLIKNNPNLKINLIFHNDPNLIRGSNSINKRIFLINNCNKIIFVSKWVKKRFFDQLTYKHKNNSDIIYNFIKPIIKFPKKII